MELTLNEVRARLREMLPRGYRESRAYAMDGDHFQDAAGWIGPPNSLDSSIMTAALKQQIERQFTPRDAIGEVLSRIENSLFRVEPRVGLVGLEEEEEDARRDEAVRLLHAWWDRTRLFERLKVAGRMTRWAGRAYLRPWVPPAHLAEDPETGVPVVPAGSFDEQMERIYVDVVEPESATILVDPDTQQRVSVYLYRQNDRDFAELSWVDEDGITQVRVLGEGRDGVVEYSYELGGRLMLVEVEAEILITDAIRRQQKRLNFFETVMTRNVETGGFPERVVANAEPEYTMVAVQRGAVPGPYPTRVMDGVTYELRPVPRTMGSSVITEIQGVKYRDASGSETLATPVINRFDPIDPAFTIRAARHAYQTLLEEAKQGHVLMSGDATSSGVSRIQARADFEADLSNMKASIEAGSRDLIELVIALAGEFSGDRRYLDDYRVGVDLVVNGGPVTPEEQRSVRELRDAGLLSTESAMVRAAGVEDVAEEAARIEAEEGGRLAMLDRRARSLKLLIDAQVPLDAAMRMVEFDEDQIGLITRRYQDIEQ
jgi:hypothetical protein